MRAKTTTVGLAVVAVGASMVAAMAQQNIGQYGYCSFAQACMKSMTDNWSAPSTVDQLASNEGIFVDVKEFKINKGAAKGDPSAHIAKSGAREVSDGAIIFRSGNKLYIVDGTPPR
jgi:hypothetical protein